VNEQLRRTRSGESVLLYDTYNVDSVKELLELFNRQWERFNLVHNEVLLFADNDHSTV
jgi:hypothetical protein